MCGNDVSKAASTITDVVTDVAKKPEEIYQHIVGKLQEAHRSNFTGVSRATSVDVFGGLGRAVNPGDPLKAVELATRTDFSKTIPNAVSVDPEFASRVSGGLISNPNSANAKQDAAILKAEQAAETERANRLAVRQRQDLGASNYAASVRTTALSRSNYLGNPQRDFMGA